MKICIIYHSFSGITKKLAEQLQSACGGDLIEVVPQQKYNTLTAYTVGCMRARNQECDPIVPDVIDVSAYTLLVLGTPVWMYKPTPAANAAVAALRGCGGKKAVIFATCGGKPGQTIPILRIPRFSMGIEVLTNSRGDAGGRMYDSDWDSNDPDLMTTFSASRCRMEPSYMAGADVDMEVSDWLHLPQWLSLRPVVGMRYQHLRLVAHNGIQYDLTGATPYDLLPSNSIRFKQTYWQYFIGVRSGIDAGKYIRIQDLKLTAQFDIAYVEGANEDKHLLRLGNRFTYEDTFGHAWHASVGLKKGLTKNLFLGVELDYLRISTTGSHRFLNRPLGFDMSWGNGVKVWSAQKSISLSLEYRFN